MNIKLCYKAESKLCESGQSVCNKIAWCLGLGIQKICLKVILGDMYNNYEAALEMCGLDTLRARRETCCFDFSL